jgi:hypothetical protein
MASPAATSLLGLPTEVRLQIYEHIFQGHVVNITGSSMQQSKCPGIFMVCRQTFSESLPVARSMTDFRFALPMAVVKQGPHAGNTCDFILPDITLLKHLCLSVRPWPVNHIFQDPAWDLADGCDTFISTIKSLDFCTHALILEIETRGNGFYYPRSRVGCIVSALATITCSGQVSVLDRTLSPSPYASTRFDELAEALGA